MRHNICTDALGPAGVLMGDALQACVHCGFCLPTCPTYKELNQEMDSPRGRIILMKEVLEGDLSLESALPHIDRCLGCMACETSCPSGVEYGNLLGPFREMVQKQRKRKLGEKLRRKLLLMLLPFPRRFRLAVKLGLMARRLENLLPKGLRPMISLLPASLAKTTKLPSVISPKGKPRARVALLTGCAQQVLDPSINQDAVDVLVRNGVEVLVPPDQTCCGALGWHVGEGDGARAFARKNLSVFKENVDAIVTTAAGCGSGLKEYPLLMKGRPEEGDARNFSSKVMDFSEFLCKVGLVETPPPTKILKRVVYQDACHLLHAQGVSTSPRKLIQSISGLELLEVKEAEICCGSAGTYNMDQPEIAKDLGKRKVLNLLGANPNWIVSSNIGCITQMKLHLQNRQDSPPTIHLANLLRMAYERKL